MQFRNTKLTTFLWDIPQRREATLRRFLCSCIISSHPPPYNFAFANVYNQAQFAESEESIILSINACKPPSPGHLQLIRADFITCSLPIDSLRDSCVSGADNEPNDCGFGSATTTTTSGAGGGVNLPGLCHYCAKSSENATDSCCVEAKAETRCNGINLPSVTIPPLFPPSIKSVDFSGAPPAVGDQGLSGGKVAGAVIGGLAAGAVLLLALLFWFLRRRGRSGFMQPRQPVSPERKSSLTPPADADAAAAAAMFVGNQQQQQSSPAGKRETSQRGVDQNPLPAGIRTASLGDHASDGAISSRNEHSLIPAALYAATPIQPRRTPPPPPPPPAPPAHSSSSPEESSATSGNDSSQSDSASPTSTDHSERLTSFKDHYSPDDIHPNDEVAVLWPYLPRAPDEFQLERGEMLRIVGIWDDGWATGYKVNSRAEDWGVGSSGRQSIAGSIMTGRGVGVKAFPVSIVAAFA